MRKEFIHKLNRFEQCVSERTYKKIAEVPFIGFVTKERLSLGKINYKDENWNEYEESRFWTKNHHLLIIYHLRRLRQCLQSLG